MTHTQILDWINKEIAGRWPDTEVTQAMKDDLYSGLLCVDAEIATRAATQQRADSQSKYPNAARIVRIARELQKKERPITSKNYTDIWIYFVYLGGADPQSPVGRWVKGTLKSVVLRSPAGTDIQDNGVAAKVIDWARQYIADNYRVLAMNFEIYLEELAAKSRSWTLKGMPY
jgi:hypothetical protein